MGASVGIFWNRSAVDRLDQTADINYINMELLYVKYDLSEKSNKGFSIWL